jgi:hypothetical protein
LDGCQNITKTVGEDMEKLERCAPAVAMQNAAATVEHHSEVPQKTKNEPDTQWFKPVILATQEAEIRRIEIQSQPGQTVHKNLSQKKKKSPKRADRVAQGVGHEFKPQHLVGGGVSKSRDSKSLNVPF